MKSTYLSGMLATALLTLGVVAPAAHAGGTVNWSVGVSSGPGVVYAPPPPVYAYPQPVYVQPQPVYVQPQAVYVEPAPVVVYGSPGYVTYGQPYYVEQRPQHRHHHHRDYNGGNFRQGNDYSR